MNCDCTLAMDMRSYELCSGVFYWSVFLPVPLSLPGGPRAPGEEFADAGLSAMELGDPRALGRVEEQAEQGIWCICERKEPQRREGTSACCQW